jgi:cation transport regulator ChaB
MSGSNVREDFLDEDNEIPSQRYVLLSFLSPEKVLARKDQYFFEQFLKNYEINYKTKNLEKFLAQQVLDFNAKLDSEVARLETAEQSEAAEICRKSRIPVGDVLSAYQTYVKENAKEITVTKIKEDFDDFMFTNEKRLEDDFHAKNSFQTTIRGLKVRGSYGSQDEAAARDKKLQRNDPVHNIFVAEVGKWLAWDPSPSNVKDQEYQNDELNTLMKAYKDNEEKREDFYKENPDARTAAKKAVRTEKEIMSIVGDKEDKEDKEASSAGGEHASLFEGPADLALQRKLEREASKKE